MSWDEVRDVIPQFDKVLADIGVTVSPTSPMSPQLELVKEFLRDRETLEEIQVSTKWTQGNRFKDLYDAVIGTYRFARAVVALQNQSQKRLRDTIKTVLAGSVTQDFKPCQAKDFFYELDVACLLQKVGFTVTLREPDIVVHGNGLSQEIGIACKFPSSEKQIHEHISKGYKQLTRQNLPGLVAFGMDLLVFSRVYEKPPTLLDFHNNAKHPLAIAQDHMNQEMNILVPERAQKYPSELPLDGAILSFNVWGVFGKPTGLTEVTAWTIQCDEDNPIKKDINVIVDAMQSGRHNPQP